MSDVDLYRELGAITQHLQSIDKSVGELAAYQKAQNGRVGRLETTVAVLEDRNATQVEDNTAMRDRLKEVEGRWRVWALGVGGPTVAALIGVLLHG